ncbi:MAG: SMC-Scp complex subunit ScpB [Candidatus Tectomicrobia bacterium]|nr:SMC-Scp complex subunit ScpB [Candidatus Tectomicrobia bacterium]
MKKLAQNLKTQAEAILFLSATSLSLERLCQLLNEEPKAIAESLEQLLEDYRSRDTALEIVQSDEGYLLQIKPAYAQLVEKIAPLELDSATLKTLSLIALRQPLEQSKLIELRGTTAYAHVQTLLKRELITREPKGRTFLLKTSSKFAQQFQLPHDAEAIRKALGVALERDP